MTPYGNKNIYGRRPNLTYIACLRDDLPFMAIERAYSNTYRLRALQPAHEKLYRRTGYLLNTYSNELMSDVFQSTPDRGRFTEGEHALDSDPLRGLSQAEGGGIRPPRAG